jgi:hypothetical protein
MLSEIPAHVCEIRSCKDRRSVDLISDALPFGKFRYAEPNALSNAIGYAQSMAVSEG